MQVEAGTPALRARATPAQLAWRWTLGAALLLAICAALLGVVFAGSAQKLAEGVTIAGIEVGGLTASEAQGLLEGRSGSLAGTPVVFTSGSERWAIKPATLGVKVDWAAAVDAARRQGEGLGPFRGFKRLQVRFFGADVSPPTQVYEAALNYQLTLLAQDIDRRPREAAVVRKGLSAVVVPARTGRTLDQEAAAGVLVRALAAFDRAPVGLPIRVQPPQVTAARLAPVAAGFRTAVSAPVRLTLGETRYRLPRWRIAQLLDLPENGATKLRIGGPAATAYFERLAETAGRDPVDATFAVRAGGVEIVPDRPGVTVDVPLTARALLAAALSPTRREAEIATVAVPAERTAADAKAMGITEQLSSYGSAYAGSPDRVRNLQLAVAALDGALVAPGGTFSFNERVGERTTERGYGTAPVIIGGEYEEDIGGGVSQVATTVFNAAWEAGVKIVERNPHALYISRYQLGRDATVNYPDLDLRFVNDTARWLLVKGGYDESGIRISLYGGERRRIESIPGTLRVTGPPPVRRLPDPGLPKGKSVVEEPGTNATAVSVERVIYSADGELIRRETWSTSYRGEYRVLRVGTKPKPKPKPLPKEGEPVSPSLLDALSVRP